MSRSALPDDASGARLPRIAFAGDRDVSVAVLDVLLAEGVRPLALLLPDDASHAEALRARCEHLAEEHVFAGRAFAAPAALETLRALRLDYLICVHFPHVLPPAALDLPRLGAVNLHPAFLPYNRGWHTPSWAILEGTPYGATLHFMTGAVDAGAIIHQRRLAVRPNDTADTLYRRAKQLEVEVFAEAWPALAASDPPRTPQDPDAGTQHRKRDLLSEDVQQIALDEPVPPRQLLDRLRALTTNRLGEAAFMVVDGQRYRVQVRITPDPADPAGEGTRERG